MHCSEDKTTGEKVDLSIIIVNYNTYINLTMCLRTLFTHPPSCSFEILVVDNASGDGSAELVRVKYPDVRLIVNRYNYGFSVANNQAYRESRGRYVMTLNPDTEIPPGTIDRLVQFLDTRPDVGLVSPAILSEDGSVQAPDHSFPRFCRPVLLAMLCASVEPSGPQATIETPWIFGTGYICRKEAIPSERFFDEDTFLFGEEYGLCRNMKKNGFKLYILPDARIRHHVSVSFKRDAGALAMARKLVTAVLWRMRKQQYGWGIAMASQLLCCADALLMWLALKLKQAVSAHDPGRGLMLADYRARLVASLALMIRGDRYFSVINAAARRYFNDGVTPPRLPAPTDG